MKFLLPFPFLLCVAITLSLGCTAKESDKHPQEDGNESLLVDTQALGVAPTITESSDSIIDPRDGEVYATVKIGNQTWLAENVRYESPGSMVNPDNPTKAYGRLYEVIAAQTACPKGWHLPSDEEWDILEIAHGMPPSFIDKGGWRGEHATTMMSIVGWDENGTNALGFNVLPAGYYFSEKVVEEPGMEGLGFSAAYWSALRGTIAQARFMFGVRKFVNKWADTNNDSGAALSCRCVKNLP